MVPLLATSNVVTGSVAPISLPASASTTRPLLLHPILAMQTLDRPASGAAVAAAAEMSAPAKRQTTARAARKRVRPNFAVEEEFEDDTPSGGGEQESPGDSQRRGKRIQLVVHEADIPVHAVRSALSYDRGGNVVIRGISQTPALRYALHPQLSAFGRQFKMPSGSFGNVLDAVRVRDQAIRSFVSSGEADDGLLAKLNFPSASEVERIVAADKRGLVSWRGMQQKRRRLVESDLRLRRARKRSMRDAGDEIGGLSPVSISSSARRSARGSARATDDLARSPASEPPSPGADEEGAMIHGRRMSHHGGTDGVEQVEMDPPQFMSKMLSLMNRVSTQHEEFLRLVSRSLRDANDRHQRLYSQLVRVCNDFLGEDATRSIPQGAAAAATAAAFYGAPGGGRR